MQKEGFQDVGDISMWEMKPEILTHPNIPMPLHGINPRSIKGVAWWNKTRQEAYKRTEYHCVACGISKENAQRQKHLEAHEYFDIDYQTGRCEVISIEPLCHYCHNFIHSGRLSHIIGREKSLREAKEILQHGFDILDQYDLQVFPDTYIFAKNLRINTYGVTPYQLNVNPKLKWEDFVLILDGIAYPAKPNPHKINS